MNRSFLSLWLILCVSTLLSAQTVADSLTIVHTLWKVSTLREGMVCRQAEIPSLYGVPQHITFLEIDPSGYKLGIEPSFPKAETSVTARNCGAVAAINGSYFNVQEGTSICYLRQQKAVTDTTTTSEFNLRVTGAVEIHKGKLSLIPWDKQTEVGYKKKKRDVLASGPLLLYNGEVCDFSGCGKGFVETKHPRSAIARTSSGKILLMTVDGRFPGQAEGISIPELAHLLRVLGATEALNLDGGGSSTLWSSEAPDNGVLNKLCDNKKYDNEGERKVANAICVFP
ncbi:MAG: phosphodiester glycosidase family protein [Bacteroides sp.]|nr:phosphodiester glycosidase family protein [Bacteroides sp.]